ncbi:hypothetical protein EC957_011228 [Mortierella hygrophila]|uniref:Uncharacterized protein n=1 Tax=Mortierella hygrophila TaxID=979708 RepID=A0A9P6F833_9FUNG|nr:hypothetical protein EC957_011228 [Mortierella hygrophila]
MKDQTMLRLLPLVDYKMEAIELMIITKLRFLACMLLVCLAWNVEACTKVKGTGKLYTMWSNYFPTPLKRTMQFSLDFKDIGHKCRMYVDFGAGDFMTRWAGASDDGNCLVLADSKTGELMARYEGYIYAGTYWPEVIDDSNAYTSSQQLMYSFELSRFC